MLKDLVETGAVPSRMQLDGVQSFPGLAYVGITKTCDMADIADAMKTI